MTSKIKLLLISIAIVVFLIGVWSLLGQKGTTDINTEQKETSSSSESLQKSAEQILIHNNITVYSYENTEETKFYLDAIANHILATSFPNLPSYINKTVWKVSFQGEIPERNYFVIIDPVNNEIVGAFGTDRRAAPGIRPLEID